MKHDNQQNMSQSHFKYLAPRSDGATFPPASSFCYTPHFQGPTPNLRDAVRTKDETRTQDKQHKPKQYKKDNNRRRGSLFLFLYLVRVLDPIPQLRRTLSQKSGRPSVAIESISACLWMCVALLYLS